MSEAREQEIRKEVTIFGLKKQTTELLSRFGNLGDERSHTDSGEKDKNDIKEKIPPSKVEFLLNLYHLHDDPALRDLAADILLRDCKPEQSTSKAALRDNLEKNLALQLSYGQDENVLEFCDKNISRIQDLAPIIGYLYKYALKHSFPSSTAGGLKEIAMASDAVYGAKLAKIEVDAVAFQGRTPQTKEADICSKFGNKICGAYNRGLIDEANSMLDFVNGISADLRKKMPDPVIRAKTGRSRKELIDLGRKDLVRELKKLSKDYDPEREKRLLELLAPHQEDDYTNIVIIEHIIKRIEAGILTGPNIDEILASVHYSRDKIRDDLEKLSTHGAESTKREAGALLKRFETLTMMSTAAKPESAGMMEEKLADANNRFSEQLTADPSTFEAELSTILTDLEQFAEFPHVSLFLAAVHLQKAKRMLGADEVDRDSIQYDLDKAKGYARNASQKAKAILETGKDLFDAVNVKTASAALIVEIRELLRNRRAFVPVTRLAAEGRRPMPFGRDKTEKQIMPSAAEIDELERLKPEEAMSLLDSLIEAGQANVDLMIKRFSLALKNGDFSKAGALLERIYGKIPVGKFQNLKRAGFIEAERTQAKLTGATARMGGGALRDIGGREPANRTASWVTDRVTSQAKNTATRKGEENPEN